MKGFRHGLAAAIAILPVSWAEAQISYSYLEGTLSANKIDTAAIGQEEDGFGGQFTASYAVMPYLHVFGGYRYSELSDFDLQTTFAQAGVGTHYDVSETKSVFLNVSAIATDVELDDPVLGSIQGDDDGYGVSIGYREINQTPMEFRLSIDYVALNDANTSDTSGDISLQYRITPRMKIFGGFQFGSDNDTFRAGVRYYLPNRNERRR